MYAVVSRIVTPPGVLVEAFLPPLLSGRAMVFASGSVERMQALMTKAFKVVLALSVFPWALWRYSDQRWPMSGPGRLIRLSASPFGSSA